MRLAACWVCGATLVATAIGCGGGGKKTLSNSTWQLYASTSATYDQHFINGVDGENDNTVSCTTDGRNVVITLRDAGRAVDTDDDGEPDTASRKPSEVEIRADLNDASFCSVEVRENAASAPPISSDPLYKDSCAKGCTISLSGENDGTTVKGTLKCTMLTQEANPSAEPLVLADNLMGGGRAGAMQISLENCK